VQNLWAKWEQPFRRFAPPNLGQRHFPLYEASLLSTRTVELPFMLLSFSLLFSCGKIDVSFSRLTCFGRVECKIQAGIVNARIKNITTKKRVDQCPLEKHGPPSGRNP
jgi:hypothetical protein